MNVPRRAVLQLGVAAAALPAALKRRAQAQAYPLRPVRLIVGLAAGGGTDLVARIIAERLTQQLGQQVFVENRTGVAGNLATQSVVSSPADGHTLLFIGPSNTISASIYKNLSFSFLRDIVPIAGVMRFPNVMVVPPSLPVRNVQELIDYARAHPDGLSMASSGVGASPHLSGELFQLMTGVRMVHVPYRGSAPAYPDLMAGTVHVMFDNLPGSIGLVQSGKLRALAVTSATRWNALPEIPTVAETVPGYEVNVWYGLAAPTGTPAPIIVALNQATNTILADPKLAARLAQLGGIPMPMTTDAFAKFVTDDVEKWAKVVEFANIRPE